MEFYDRRGEGKRTAPFVPRPISPLGETEQTESEQGMWGWMGGVMPWRFMQNVMGREALLQYLGTGKGKVGLGPWEEHTGREARRDGVDGDTQTAA
jgi:hypothetical protein